MSRDPYPLLWRHSGYGNTASSIVACWAVFTGLFPGNAFIRSVTILFILMNLKYFDFKKIKGDKTDFIRTQTQERRTMKSSVSWKRLRCFGISTVSCYLHCACRWSTRACRTLCSWWKLRTASSTEQLTKPILIHLTLTATNGVYKTEEFYAFYYYLYIRR
jgi:hypothetical protein